MMVLLSNDDGILARGLTAVISLGFFAVLVAFLYPGLLMHVVGGSLKSEPPSILATYVGLMSILAAINVIATYNLAIHRFLFLYALVPLAIADIFALLMFHKTFLQVINVQIVVAIVGLIATFALTDLNQLNSPRVQVNGES